MSLLTAAWYLEPSSVVGSSWIFNSSLRRVKWFWQVLRDEERIWSILVRAVYRREKEKKLEEIQKQIVMVWIRKKKQLWKWLEKLSRERTTIVRVGQVIKVFRRRFLCCTHHHHRCCYFWWGLVTWAVRRRPSRSLFHQVLHIILLSLTLLRVLWTCWKPIRFCHTLSLSAGQQVPLLLLLRQGSQTRLKRPRENAAT